MMAKVAIALLIAIVIALALVVFLDRSGRFCPEGQVSVLGEDRWVCVKGENT